MPFAPALPVNHSPLASAEMRAQLTSLKALIDDDPTNEAMAAAIEAAATPVNGIVQSPRPFADPAAEALRVLFNALLVAGQRGGVRVPGKAAVSVDGLNTPTQTGHADAAGATEYVWLLMRDGMTNWEQIAVGPPDSVDMVGLSGASNFLVAIPSNAFGTGPASDPVQFAGGL